jgi:hypothetical protein
MYIKCKKDINMLEQITAQLVASSDDSISTCVIKAAQIIKECENAQISPLSWKSVQGGTNLSTLHFSQGGRYKIEEFEIYEHSPVNKKYVLHDYGMQNTKIWFLTLDEAKEFAEFLRVR